MAVDPVGPAAALHFCFQLQGGQAGQLAADDRRQSQGQGVRVMVQRLAIDGGGVPVLDGPLHLVADQGAAADDVLDVCVCDHAFSLPRCCQTGSMPYLAASMLWLLASIYPGRTSPVFLSSAYSYSANSRAV